MAAIQITASNGVPFPQDTRIRIEAILTKPKFDSKTKETILAQCKKELVWSGEVTESLTRNLDPGRYIVTAIKHDAETGGFWDQHTFYHGCDETNWLKIVNMKPKLCRSRHTVDGVLYMCSFYGCTKAMTSRFAAIIHEAEHLGVDILKATPEQTAQVASKAQEIASVAKKDKEAAMSGRPQPIVSPNSSMR